jgi:hypothetical protein
MKDSLSRHYGSRFQFDWTWHQMLGGALLIFLGWLTLIWPLPLLIVLAALLVLLFFLIRPYAAIVIATLLIAVETFSLMFVLDRYRFVYGPCYFMASFGLLCWIPARLAGITPPYESTTIDAPLLVLFVTLVIALLWTPFFNDGLQITFFTIMSYSFYLLICAMNSTPQHLERLFWLWFWLGILIIITTFSTCFFSYLNSIPIFDNLYLVINIAQYDGTRITLKGMGACAKGIAGVLNVSIICGLTLLCTQVRRISKIFIFIALMAMLFLHLLTMSRLETICLLFGWIAFAYLNPQWRNNRIRQHLRAGACVLIVLLAMLAMLTTFYNANELLARVIAEEQTVGYRFSGTQNRWDHIVVALDGIWASAGLGAGTRGIMGEMDPSVWIDSPSLYFSFLTDHGYGILSVILMLWIMTNLIVELHRAFRTCSDPRFKIFIVGVCSLLLMFGNPLGDQFFYMFQMWILLGFAAVAIKAVRRQVESSP